MMKCSRSLLVLLSLFLCSLCFSSVSSSGLAGDRIAEGQGFSRENSKELFDKVGIEEARIVLSLRESMTDYLQLMGLDEETVRQVEQIVSGALTMLGLVMEDRTSEYEQRNIASVSNSTIETPSGFPCNTLQRAVCVSRFGFDICSTFGTCKEDTGGICKNDYFLSCAICVCA